MVTNRFEIHLVNLFDQIRTVNQVRLVRKMGTLDAAIATTVLDVLQELFAP